MRDRQQVGAGMLCSNVALIAGTLTHPQLGRIWEQGCCVRTVCPCDLQTNATTLLAHLFVRLFVQESQFR